MSGITKETPKMQPFTKGIELKRSGSGDWPTYHPLSFEHNFSSYIYFEKFFLKIINNTALIHNVISK